MRLFAPPLDTEKAGIRYYLSNFVVSHALEREVLPEADTAPHFHFTLH